MTAPPHATNGPPERILLATDLSARCDRALDRAALLAAGWRAQLIALNILEPEQAPDLLLRRPGESDASLEEFARRQLEHDLAIPDLAVGIHIARGAPDAVIRDIARDEDCGLVVTGMARNETFGRFLLGSTVRDLARNLAVPLLVVRQRARSRYTRVLVATDLSPASRHTLRTAVRFFPDAELTLYHAYQGPLGGLADRPGDTEAICREIERGALADFLTGCDLPTAVTDRLRRVVEYGPLATTLTAYVRRDAAELVALGNHGGLGLVETLLGSSAERMLEWLPCDTLLVRQPAGAD